MEGCAGCGIVGSFARNAVFQDIVHVDTVPCAVGNIQRQAALKRADKLFSGFAARGQVDDRIAVAAEAVEAEQVLQQRLDLDIACILLQAVSGGTGVGDADAAFGMATVKP